MSRLDKLHQIRVTFEEGMLGPATTLRNKVFSGKTLSEVLAPELRGLSARYNIVRLGFVRLFSTLELLCPD